MTMWSSFNARKITMKRAFVGVMVLGLLVMAVAPAAASAAFSFTFDPGLAPWAGKSLPVQSITPPRPASSNGPVLSLQVEQLHGVKNSFAGLAGNSSGLFYMYTKFASTDNTVRVKFQAKKLTNCGNCIPVVFVGDNYPSSAGRFKVLGTGLGEDWQTYVYETPFKASSIVVAVGYINTQPVGTKAGVDNISVELSSH